MTGAERYAEHYRLWYTKSKENPYPQLKDFALVADYYRALERYHAQEPVRPNAPMFTRPGFEAYTTDQGHLRVDTDDRELRATDVPAFFAWLIDTFLDAKGGDTVDDPPMAPP